MASVIEYRPPAVRRSAIVNGIGMLRRAFGAYVDAMEESRRRQADREIARYVGLQDNRMTDYLEREILRLL